MSSPPNSPPNPAAVHAPTPLHSKLVWLLATLLASSAAILTRYANIPATSIGFWRVFGAAVFLSPFCYAAWMREGRPLLFTRGTTLVGTLFGLHFATWCWALQNTTIANALLFIGLQPLIAPFLARPLLGERLNRGEILACLLACVGMFWILGGQVSAEREHLAGSLVAFISACFCAAYFVLTRKYRSNRSPMTFGVPVYATAAAVQAIAGLAVDGGIFIGDAPTRWALLGLILLPTVGGHTLAIYLLKHVSSQMVTLTVPAQFILGSLAAMFLFREIPSLWFCIGAALVLCGVVMGVSYAGAARKSPGRCCSAKGAVAGGVTAKVGADEVYHVRPVWPTPARGRAGQKEQRPETKPSQSHGTGSGRPGPQPP